VDRQISAQIVVGDDGMSGHGHMTVLQLSWHRGDPLVVRLRLSAEPDHPALPRGEWMILRDFLRYGLEEATGDGDVRIRPNGEDQMLIELTNEVRPYRMTVGASIVCDFLDKTEAIVPAGAEAEDEVFDALIERLLEY